jgi:hypothetical protein
MFTEEFRRRLSGGECSRWASDLDEEQLVTVLWAVGELGRRAGPLLECLDRHQADFAPSVNLLRVRGALAGLARMTAGERLTLGDMFDAALSFAAGRHAEADERAANDAHRNAGD